MHDSDFHENETKERRAYNEGRVEGHAAALAIPLGKREGWQKGKPLDGALVLVRRARGGYLLGIHLTTGPQGGGPRCYWCDGRDNCNWTRTSPDDEWLPIDPIAPEKEDADD